jgi:hypothetical protein
MKTRIAFPVFFFLLSITLPCHSKDAFLRATSYFFDLHPVEACFASQSPVLPDSQSLPQQNKPECSISNFDKALNLSVGVVSGFLLGGFIGGLFGENLYTCFQSGLIGVTTFPLFNYEMLLARRGVRSPMLKWCLIAGGNSTFSNHRNTDAGYGSVLGISRNFRLSTISSLRWEACYDLKRCRLPFRRTSYTTPDGSEIRYYDIDFLVGYVVVSLAPQFRILSLSKATIKVALGPAVSIPLFERTSYRFIKSEPYSGGLQGFDFAFYGGELPHITPFTAAAFSIEADFGRLIMQIRMSRALDLSHQILLMSDVTRLSSAEIVLGFKF